MDPEQFTNQFEQLQARIDALFTQAAGGDQPEVLLPQALEDIHILVEELQVADMELHTQNDLLASAQLVVEAERQRYQDLFEFAPDGYLVTDTAGVILEANWQAARLLNVPEDRMTKKILANFVAVEERENFRQRLSQLALLASNPTQPIYQWEIHFTPRGLKDICAEITVAHVPLSVEGLILQSTTPTSATALAATHSGALRWQVRDISEREQAQQALEQAKIELEDRVAVRTEELRQANAKLFSYARELESKNRDLQDFAAIAAHDLQEPLRKIRSFSDRLTVKSGALLGEEGRDYLERMRNSAIRMQAMLDSLLIYARVGSRTQPFTWLDLHKVIDVALQDLDLEVERTKAEVEVGDLPGVSADEAQIQRLFLNLLNNALKFQQPGAIPRVKIWGDPAEPGWIEISVQDNGIGFDEKYLDRIFQPFQRLHGRGEYAGEGMGLPICRKIAERHGGRITAHSAPQQGTTFIVILPVNPLDSVG